MARGDDLHAIKYLPLKLKGPARHWLKSLPENTMGSWEVLEDAFRANFQGTYVRPPDADDLSHITQQPGESARRVSPEALEQIPYQKEADSRLSRCTCPSSFQT